MRFIGSLIALCTSILIAWISNTLPSRNVFSVGPCSSNITGMKSSSSTGGAKTSPPSTPNSSTSPSFASPCT
uniref:Putative secreted protein n=1 Tax=Panstrongylus lignarius TaxID=156445 RepID=A0A224Y6A9_9HEMI